eukprot:TRINITY_DN6100_c0_g1_i1.p1 TRINITY_DN6100_c0_g1~~TRINITY_DN6100_c0_g1_i1.p1  ORF type:complete len:239 (+),score=32.25 TRINITY_DN6100_c0_g1_i1:26-742(+)
MLSRLVSGWMVILWTIIGCSYIAYNFFQKYEHEEAIRFNDLYRELSRVYAYLGAILFIVGYMASPLSYAYFSDWTLWLRRQRKRFYTASFIVMFSFYGYSLFHSIHSMSDLDDIVTQSRPFLKYLGPVGFAGFSMLGVIGYLGLYLLRGKEDLQRKCLALIWSVFFTLFIESTYFHFTHFVEGHDIINESYEEHRAHIMSYGTIYTTFLIAIPLRLYNKGNRMLVDAIKKRDEQAKKK